MGGWLTLILLRICVIFRAKTVVVAFTKRDAFSDQCGKQYLLIYMLVPFGLSYMGISYATWCCFLVYNPQHLC